MPPYILPHKQDVWYANANSDTNDIPTKSTSRNKIPNSTRFHLCAIIFSKQSPIKDTYNRASFKVTVKNTVDIEAIPFSKSCTFNHRSKFSAKHEFAIKITDGASVSFSDQNSIVGSFSFTYMFPFREFGCYLDT